MAVSIVKVPSDDALGLDFLAFSFNGKHSWDDFGIYRVIESNRYNENLAPTLTDKTAEVPGGDGMYYFGTYHKQREFSINFAFDHLTEEKLREMKKWLNGKEMGDLWFQEAPHKVWTAKLTGNSSIKYIPFDEFDQEGNKIQVYKGEGTIQFVAYWPYAHTPNFVQLKDGTKLSGNYYKSYSAFSNYEQIKSCLPNYSDKSYSYGDLPFTFVAYLDDVTSDRNSSMKVDSTGIEYSAKTDDGIVIKEEE